MRKATSGNGEVRGRWAGAAPRGRARAGACALVAVLAAGLGACDGPAAEAAPANVVSTSITAAGATNPTVAVGGAAGEAYVAWVGVRDGVANVYFAEVSGDGTVSEPVRVNDIDGDAAPHAQAPAQVVAGPGDDLYVAWQSVRDVEYLDFGASDVRIARSTDGGRTWEPAVTVNDNLPGQDARNTFHDVAVGADGTVYVSWIDARVRDGYRGEVFRETGRAPDPASEPGTEIRVARSTDGGKTFSPSVVLETNSCPCCRTSTVVGPDGTVYVAYRKVFEGQIRDIVVSRSNDGGQTFSAPVRVHEDDWHIEGCPHAGARLAVDADGRLHVAWFTGAEGEPGAYYTVSDDQGQTFAEPTRLTPEGPVPTSLASVATDADGGVWVAWEDPSAGGRQVALARVEGDRGVRRVEIGEPAGATPAIAAADGGMALAWQGGEGIRVITGR